MAKPGLVLLDANVIIYLFEIRAWDLLVSKCNVVLARTVLGEVDFYIDASGVQHRIDLQPYEDDKQFSVVDVLPSELDAFRNTFSTEYLEKLDPGETESLVYLLANRTHPGFQFLCSSDKIVFRVLGAKLLSEYGISLEELLKQLGIGRKVAYQFAKEFRDKSTKQGLEEGLQGRATPPK